MNYYNLLEIKRNINKEKILLIIDGDSYTYNDILNDSKKIGEQILVGKNIPILIYSKSIKFQLTSFFAVNYCENIPIICHYNLSEPVIRDILLKNKISIIISNEILSINNLSMDYYNDELYIYRYSNPVNCLDDSICMGALSSGSTNVPKVLYRTYKSWSGFFHIQNEIFNIESESILFINGTLSFTGNLNAMMSTIYEGGSIVVNSSLNCKSWINAIKEYNVTNLYLIPTKLQLLANHLNEVILRLKCIFTGSQLLFESTAKRLKYYMPNSEIILYYGASELNYITYLCYEELIKKPSSVGKPFPEIEVYIKDNIIFVETEYAVYNTTRPYSVNDVGYFDDDGYLIFEGRNDDVVNVGGFKVSPTKVENIVKKVEQVENAVVLPFVDNIRGSQVVLFVTTKHKLTKKDLLFKIRNNLLKNEIPRKIIFLESFPYTPSEKIDRLALLEMLER